MAREDIPLREITTSEIWAEVQKLRNELQTHNHLDIGNAQILTGTLKGITQSSNFVSGSAGAQVNWATGNVEFNAGIFRGALSGNSITIGTNAWHVDTDGNMWWGNSSTYAGATIKISSAGSVNLTTGVFSGTLSAASGSLGEITTGLITLDASGYIRGGQTAFDTGIGFFLGYSTDAYKFSIGDPAGDKMTWDGSVLKISGTITNTRSAEAGENLGVNDTVYLSTGALTATKKLENTAGASNASIYGIRWGGQTFGLFFAEESTITKIKVSLRKVGTPVGNITLEMFDVSAGIPSGGALASSVLVADDALGAAYGLIEFVLDTPVDTDANTLYVFTWKVPDTNDANRVEAEYANSGNPYAGGTFLYSSNSGVDWTIESTFDYEFEVYGKPRADRVYKTDASFNDERIDGFMGFNTEIVSAGGTAKINILGVQSGLSGLTSEKEYYLSDTPGEITKDFSSITYRRRVGWSISTTQIFLLEDEMREDWIADDNTRNSNDGQKQTAVGSYTKLKEILLNEDLPACRIYFQIYGGLDGNPVARVYKNGVAIGIVRDPPADTAWHAYTEDFTGFVLGDLIQIYGYAGGVEICIVRYMRLQYSQRITKLRKHSLDTPLTLSTTVSVTNQDPA